MMGFTCAGVSELLEVTSVPIHIQRDEADYVARPPACRRRARPCTTAATSSGGRLDPHRAHPHAGSHAGQPVLPGRRTASSPATPCSSTAAVAPTCPAATRPRCTPITERLAKVPDDTTLFPGHLYSPEPSASMGETRRTNMVFRPGNVDEFLRMFS